MAGVRRAALERRYARPQSRFALIEGVRLHWIDEGPLDAIPVIALSSQWASFSQWDGWAPQLTDGYRVLRLDLPGHGLSGSTPDGDYSIARYVRLVEAFADHLGLSAVVLVGTSFSGVVAFRIAALRPDRVLALVLANSSGLPREPGAAQPNPPPPSRWLRLVERWWRPAPYMRWKLASLLCKTRITPALVDEYVAMNNAPGRIGEAAARLAAYDREPPWPLLAQITAPVLLQWSTHATYLPATDADRFERALTHATVRKIIYPDLGHLIIQDGPEATGRDVRGFLDEVLCGRTANSKRGVVAAAMGASRLGGSTGDVP
jgi:pimeloyl-ACP methyl ester carboxylesterase